MKYGKEDGYGRNISKFLDVYQGYWKDGQKHGKGKLTKSDGTVLDGKFENGVFLG